MASRKVAKRSAKSSGGLAGYVATRRENEQRLEGTQRRAHATGSRSAAMSTPCSGSYRRCYQEPVLDVDVRDNISASGDDGVTSFSKLLRPRGQASTYEAAYALVAVRAPA